jgi:hypothetical protein
MTTVAERAKAWGPLATPVHTDVEPVDADGTSWWDYALFCWWDPESEVYVMTHHMTTPDESKPGRTRVSASVGDQSVEVIEETKPDSHDGENITVDLGGQIIVDHPDLKLDVTFDPLFQPIDFHTAKGLPTLKRDEPLHHFEHPQRAAGEIALKSDERTFHGTGLRDRTWGYRNESSQWDEYQYLMAEIDDSFITLMKIRGTVDDTQRNLGFLLTEGEQENVDFSFAFNGSGLFNDVTVELPSGSVTLEITERPAAFWVPMGWRQTGKVFSAYDEFVLMRTEDGRDFAGLATYGIQRRLD